MKIHIAQPGDTMRNLAKKYNVDYEKLVKLNREFSNVNHLEVGMKVKIPTKEIAIIPKKNKTQTFVTPAEVSNKKPEQALNSGPWALQRQEIPGIMEPYSPLPKFSGDKVPMMPSFPPLGAGPQEGMDGMWKEPPYSDFFPEQFSEETPSFVEGMPVPPTQKGLLPGLVYPADMPPVGPPGVEERFAEEGKQGASYWETAYPSYPQAYSYGMSHYPGMYPHGGIYPYGGMYPLYFSQQQSLHSYPYGYYGYHGYGYPLPIPYLKLDNWVHEWEDEDDD